MKAFFIRVSRCLLAIHWIFVALQLAESKITCQIEPDEPKIVVLGVDSNAVSLKWENCIGDAGETFISFFFKRQKPGDVLTQQIASRGAHAGFTMSDPFKGFKKYRALLNQELRIYDVQRNEKYVYTLTIYYRRTDGVFEDKIFQVTVVVKEPPKITISPTREVQLNLGENYTLKCNASGDPHPNITWTKDGLPASQFSASGYSLHLVDVQREDAGSYTCTASNGFGDNVTAISIVNIRCNDCKTERVGITILGMDYKPPLSNQASIEFKNLESKLLSAIWGAYTDNPEKQLYRADVEEFRSGSVYAVVELAFGSTAIDPLKPLRDEMNDGKLGSFTVVYPIFAVPPKITAAPTRKVQLSLSSSSVQNYTLKCNASGDPHPNITWAKDGVPASQFNHSGYLLHLVDVQREDAGSYICTASNGYGDDATAIGIVNINCSDCKTEKVGITIQGMAYKPPFSNQVSIEFKNLESKLLSAIWAAYTGNPGKQLYRADVIYFRSGSVYAVVELTFGSTVIDPLKPLRDEMNDGKLGSIPVDRQLDVNPTTEPITLSPSKTTESFRFTSTEGTSMESKITCQVEPDDPKIVVLGVNSNTVSLRWETCIGNAGETFISFIFKRQKPGDVTTQQIASRGASDGFTMSDPFKDLKKYRALLSQELRIYDVQRNEKYVYTLTINYMRSDGVFEDKIFQVTVVMKVPPVITISPAREVQLPLSSSSVQNYTLLCNASGDPHPNITWTKDGLPASQFSASGYSLQLVDVRREDAGSYICTASNGFGDNVTAISIVNIRCKDCKMERVGITILGMDYKPPLSNQASIEFKNLESKLLSAIWGAYTDNPEKQLYRADAEEFRSGSVYAVVELAFGSTVIDPLKPLRDEMNNGRLGSFTVDRQLDVNPITELTTLSPSRTSMSFRFTSKEGTSKEGTSMDANWRKQRQILHAIYSTVICLLVVVVIVLVILLWRGRYKKSGPGNTTSIGYQVHYNQNSQITVSAS